MTEGSEGHPGYPGSAASADEASGPTTAEPGGSTPGADALKSAEADEPAAETAVGPFIVLGDADADACGPGGCCSG